jgi:orotate phosphoribosyltransferase
MLTYKQRFIEFMVESDVLVFGDFTTKSGRKTPFFVNTGRYRTGAQISRLARFYAQAIVDQAIAFDFLFGPAYKGIPLAVATAIALHDDHGIDVGYCFNRKQAKDHGEGGVLVGHAPAAGERVLIVEDVTTAGTAIRETVPLLHAAANVTLAGLVVSVDRMERGRGTQSTLSELADELGMRTFAIVTIEEVMQFLHGRTIGGRVVLDDATHARILDYRARYGATS